MTKAHWLLGGIFWVLVSTQACAPVAPGQKEEFGTQDLPTAKRLNEEAQLYYRQGKYAEAEPLFRRSLTINEKALGPKHPHVATGLEHYAVLLRKMNREAKAAKLEVRAIAIRAIHAQKNPAK